MQLATIQGRATATMKHASMNGCKLLIALQHDIAGRPGGDPLLIVDQMGAGLGDVVMISSDGKGVEQRLNDPNTPVRWFTLGIVDTR